MLHKNIQKNKNKIRLIFVLITRVLVFVTKTLVKGIFSKNKKLLSINFFIVFTIIILSYFIDIIYLKFMLFFLIKGMLLNFKILLLSYPKKSKIRRNNRKYKRLIEMLNNKIEIVDIDKNKITVFSNELTISELEKNINKFELFFNRKIISVKRNSKDFRYNYLIFHQKIAFKSFYKFEDYINTIEKKDLIKHQIPAILGITNKEEILLIDFAVIKNLFVAGEAGGGKSVFLNVLIQSLMIFNHESLYIMIDLKEGIELSDYDYFKNCLTISTSEDLINVISTLNKIMIRRLRLIRMTENCKNIHDYNSKSHTENMNNIFIVIDEVAEIKLNSGKQGKSSEEIKFLQIGQKGRAAGIFIIGATQRPSAEQIDTDFRACFQKSLSFCVSTKETQKMTKIQGTELLGPGEFKTNIFNDPSIICKSLFISSEENKKSKLPYSNKVFEDLKLILQDEKFFIEILEKKKTNYNNILHKIASNLYKSYPEKLPHNISYPKLIKIVPSSVKNELADIKKLSQINQNSLENTQNEHGDNYFQLLKFLLENQKENGMIPAGKIIQGKFKISKRKKDELLKKAYEENYLKKISKTNFGINKIKKWEEIIKN